MGKSIAGVKSTFTCYNVCPLSSTYRWSSMVHAFRSMWHQMHFPKYSTKQEPQTSLRLVLGSSVNAQSFRSFHTTETNATQTCAVSWNTSVPFFLGIITNNLTSGNCLSIVKEENDVDTLSLFLQFHWPKLFIKHLQEIIYLSGGFTIQNFNLLNFQMKPV